VDPYRFEATERFGQLHSFLQLVNLLCKFEVIDDPERFAAAFAILQIKKLLDEERHESIKRRSAERAVPYYVASE
jgi:hypothetical protein